MIEIRYLNGRAPRCHCGKAMKRGIPGHLHKYVNPVFADQLDEFFIGHLTNRLELVEHTLDVLLSRSAGVRDHVKSIPVVTFGYRSKHGAEHMAVEERAEIGNANLAAASRRIRV